MNRRPDPRSALLLWIFCECVCIWLLFFIGLKLECYNAVSNQRIRTIANQILSFNVTENVSTCDTSTQAKRCIWCVCVRVSVCTVCVWLWQNPIGSNPGQRHGCTGGRRGGQERTPLFYGRSSNPALHRAGTASQVWHHREQTFEGEFECQVLWSSPRNSHEVF